MNNNKFKVSNIEELRNNPKVTIISKDPLVFEINTGIKCKTLEELIVDNRDPWLKKHHELMESWVKNL